GDRLPVCRAGCCVGRRLLGAPGLRLLRLARRAGGRRSSVQQRRLETGGADDVAGLAASVAVQQDLAGVCDRDAETWVPVVVSRTAGSPAITSRSNAV